LLGRNDCDWPATSPENGARREKRERKNELNNEPWPRRETRREKENHEEEMKRMASKY